MPTVVRLEVTTPEPRTVLANTSSPSIMNFLVEPVRAICSEEVHASLLLTQLNVLSVAPLRVKPPPSAVVSVGVSTLPSSMFLSSTSRVELEIVVVVPLTVRSPVTTKF